MSTTGDDPAASIVVPTHRGVSRLPALLDALAAQGEGTPCFELVAVVDGVDDGSPRLLESEDRFPVQVLVHPENRGRVAALNTGHRAARGRVLIRCDDDLLPGPDFVRLHVDAHRGGAVAGVIGPTRDLLDPTPYARVYGVDADARRRRAARGADPSTAWRRWAANCSLTREAWDAVGEYDPDYRRYGWEDVDYGWRVREAGLAVVESPGLETPHRAAAVTTASRVLRAVHSGAARRVFERKHPHAPLPDAIPPLSPWNALVRGAARQSGLLIPASRLLDRALPLLPAPVGSKFVALLVEAGGLAGHRRPELAEEAF